MDRLGNELGPRLKRSSRTGQQSHYLAELQSKLSRDPERPTPREGSERLARGRIS